MLEHQIGRALNQLLKLKLLPKPPVDRPESTPWPYWPLIMRTSSSHEEGAERMWSVNTKLFKGNKKGEVTSLFHVISKI